MSQREAYSMLFSISLYPLDKDFSPFLFSTHPFISITIFLIPSLTRSIAFLLYTSSFVCKIPFCAYFLVSSIYSREFQ